MDFTEKLGQIKVYLEGRGYKIVETVSWIKTDNGQDLISGLGRVFQHCKEECTVGQKGDVAYLKQRFNLQKIKNTFIDLRRLGSQKPKRIYEMIGEFCPSGRSWIYMLGELTQDLIGLVLGLNQRK
ncbi:MT-A70 family protein [Oxytricha trifallax]|uniref:MT-A70 family protein n=1 Tax=Oxytricha trifallax TaxID=1172189 RepID=A0A073HZL3_9SPIT|nr:MT-A70 family protein [Oxytricha trifallax]